MHAQTNHRCPRFAGGLQARGGSDCPLNQQAVGVVRAFAQPGATVSFWAAFATSWKKMTEAGHGGSLLAPVE